MEKQINASQLKRLPVGTRVRIHERKDGLHDWKDAKIVWIDGRNKGLRIADFFDGVYIKPITDYPGKYFTVEEKDVSTR